ncbi:MAG: multiheme c-type cytochrome, partial [Candidatus Methanoperedens sp.]|nr:multiheme c-type cytochrome [Candidatus Methanoperedens sp.]
NCHDTYKDASPFYAEPIWHKGNYGATADNCYQCHTNVSSAASGFAPIAMHNVTKVIDWSYCNSCHSNNYGGAPIVDNASLASSMHYNLNGGTPSNTDPACKACHGGNATAHKNASANNCTYCHITGSLKYTTKNVSRHIPYPYTTDVNTSRYQQVFCSNCHNNSLRAFSDPTPNSSNATTAHYGMNKTAGKLMYNTSGNSEDCIYCHRNNSNMAAWGVLNTSNANLSKKGSNHATASNADCYTCHVNSTTTPVNFHVEDISAGAGGGPDCKACHDIGGNAAGKLVNFSAMNAADAIHKNLNSGASDTTSSPENKACWACHTTNGTQPQAGNHTLVDRYTAPYNCTDCHISKAGQNFNYTPKAVLNVTQHKADTVNGTTIFTPLTSGCYSCHNKSEIMIQANDPDNGTGVVYGGLHGGNASVSHYGLKRNDLGG